MILTDGNKLLLPHVNLNFDRVKLISEARNALPKYKAQSSVFVELLPIYHGISRPQKLLNIEHLPIFGSLDWKVRLV